MVDYAYLGDSAAANPMATAIAGQGGTPGIAGLTNNPYLLKLMENELSKMSMSDNNMRQLLTSGKQALESRGLYSTGLSDREVIGANFILSGSQGGNIPLFVNQQGQDFFNALFQKAPDYFNQSWGDATSGRLGALSYAQQQTGTSGQTLGYGGKTGGFEGFNLNQAPTVNPSASSGASFSYSPDQLKAMSSQITANQQAANIASGNTATGAAIYPGTEIPYSGPLTYASGAGNVTIPAGSTYSTEAGGYVTPTGQTLTSKALETLASSPTQVAPTSNLKSPIPTATNTVKGYDTNNNYAVVYVPAGKYVPGVSLYPKEEVGAISADKIESATPANLPSSTSGVTDYNTKIDSTMAGAQARAKTFNDLYQEYLSSQTPNEKKAEDISEMMMKALESQQLMAAEKVQQQNEKGFAEKMATIQSNNRKVESLLAEYSAYAEAQEGKPITMASITGSIAERKAQVGSQILKLQAQNSMLQGEMDSANILIDSALAMKYGPLDNKLAIYKAQLEAISPILTKEQQAKAWAMEQMANEQKSALTEQKTEEKNIMGILADYITAANKAGLTPDKTVMDKIGNAKTYAEALQLLGTNMPTSASEDLQFISATANQPAGVFDKTTGKFTPISGGISGKGTSIVGGGGTGTSGGKTYGSDLEAIVGSVLATIPTKFGQEQFQAQINRARNDADKISLIAATVLKNQPTQIRSDFASQKEAISFIDKAISVIDSGTKTGVLQAGAQYVYNIFGKDFDPKLTEINSNVTAALQPYRNSVTGAAWGEQENAEYNQLFGSTKYSPAELKNRLTILKEIMKTKTIGALNSYVNPMDTYGNIFNPNQPGLQLNTPTMEKRVIDNGNGTYSYLNNDGTVHTGNWGDKYEDKTSTSLKTSSGIGYTIEQ